VERRGHPVELPSAVVGDDDRARAGVDGAPCVVRDVDALDDDRSVPEHLDPLEVGPGHGRGG
jgi:hypothetical protein